MNSMLPEVDPFVPLDDAHGPGCPARFGMGDCDERRYPSCQHPHIVGDDEGGDGGCSVSGCGCFVWGES